MRRLTIFLTCAALPCVAATARFEHEGERGAVITGRLLNEAGEPLTGVAVIAAGPDRVMGRDRLTAPGGSAESDVKGRYRISGLLPDVYYVFACPPPFCPAGRNGGTSRGGEVTFYPSAPDISGAGRVRIAAGGEITNVDIVVRQPPTYELAGTLLDQYGRPSPGKPLMLFPGEDVIVAVNAEARTSSNGRFSFSKLPAGPYVLQTGDVPDDGSVAVFASAAIHLSQDMRDVLLQAREGATVRGEVLFEPAPADFDPNRLKLAARGGDFTQSPAGILEASVAVREDWTFEIINVWGPQKFEVLELPDGWMLKTVQVHGVDCTDQAVDLEAVRRTPGALRMVFTRPPSGVTGRVRDSSGRSAALAHVLAFSTDPDRWELPSRFVKRMSTDEAGRFALRRLPPGDYHLIALVHLPEYRASRTDVLESLRSFAKTVTIREGRQEFTDLTVQDRHF
jgi:hypothetical protein